MRHKVLCHQHLVVPGQVHCVIGDLANSKVLWRRYWGEKKENQKKNSNALNHRGSTTESKCKLQSHIWLWCEELPKKVNKVQTMANPHTKNLFSSRRNSFSKDEGRELCNFLPSLRMEGNYIILDLLLKVVNRWKISGLVNCHMLSCVSALS